MKTTIPPKNTLYKSILALMLSASLIACGGSGNKAGVNVSAQAEDTSELTKQAVDANIKKVAGLDNKKKEETRNQQPADDTKRVIKLLTVAEKNSAASKKEEEHEYNGLFYKTVTYKNKEGKVLFVESLLGSIAGEYSHTALTRNTYNAVGQLMESAKITAKNKDGALAEFIDDITHTYDANGKKTTTIKTTVTYDGGKPLLSTGLRTTTKYDDQGNEIDSFSETNLQADGSYAKNSRTKVSTKNVGNIVSVLLLKYTDEVFKSGTLVEITKNAKDPLKADKVVEFDADKNGKKISGNNQNTYEYHSNGKIEKRVLSSINYDAVTDKVNVLINGEHTYEYNDKGKEIFHLFKTDKDGDGAAERQEMIISEYAADGVTLTKYTTGVDDDGDGNPNKLVHIKVTHGKANPSDGSRIEEYLDNNGTVTRTIRVGDI